MRTRPALALPLVVLLAACEATPPAEDVGKPVEAGKFEVSLTSLAAVDVPYAAGGLNCPERTIAAQDMLFVPVGDAFELEVVRIDLATGKSERATLLKPRCPRASALVARPAPAVVYDEVRELEAVLPGMIAVNVDHDPFSDLLAASEDWAATVYQGYYDKYADEYLGLARQDGKEYKLLVTTQLAPAAVHGDRVVTDVDLVSEGDRAVAVAAHENGVTLVSSSPGVRHREDLDHERALCVRVLGTPADPTIIWTAGSALKIRAGTAVARLDFDSPIVAMDAVSAAKGTRVVLRFADGRSRLVAGGPGGAWAVADLEIRALSGPELAVWNGRLLVIAGSAGRVSVQEVVER